MTSRLLGSPWSVAARSIAYWSLPRNHKRIQLNAPYRKIPRYGGEVTIAPTDRTLRQVRSPSSFTASPCTTATRGPTGSALDLRSQATRSRSLARKSIAGWQRPLRSTKRRTYSGDMLKVLGMSTERSPYFRLADARGGLFALQLVDHLPATLRNDGTFF